jgi:hypothetical protein
METMHVIKIGDGLFQELVGIQREKKLSSVGAACEIFIEQLKEMAR